MINFSIRQLEVFITVVERNSFSKAADALSMAQSTISGHIKGLEDALSVVLFVRDAKKQIQLTDRGREIYELANPIVEQCRIISDDAAGKLADQELSIAASTDSFEYLLPAVMADYMKSHESCHYLLINGDSAFVHEQIIRKTARLGFVGTALDKKNLKYRHVCRDKLVMITPNNERYRAFLRDGAYGSDLITEPMIVRGESSGTKKEFDKYLRTLGKSDHDLHIVARMNQADAVKSSVANGLGVAVISEMAAQKYASNGELLVFDLDADGAYRSIYLVHRKDLVFSKGERDFMNFAINHIRHLRTV